MISARLFFKTKWAIVQLYHGKNTLHSMRWCLLCTRPTRLVSWIFIVLAHWDNSPWVDMSLHSDILFRFRANKSLILFLNAAYWAEKQQIQILQSLVSPDHSLNPQYTLLSVLKVNVLTIALPIWCLFTTGVCVVCSLVLCDEVYLIQHYVINLVSDLLQVGSLPWVL